MAEDAEGSQVTPPALKPVWSYAAPAGAA